MNKNKLIFAIIWAILLIGILFIALNLKNAWPEKSNIKTTWDFDIWIVWDDVNGAMSTIANFKQMYPKYSNTVINIESFSSYDDYYYALTSAIISDKAPDLFVLNNNEKNSVFSNQVIWINPNILNPNDFRKKYKWVFADDLIISTWEWENKQEFLMWVPVWYESLWIFYNRQYIMNSKLSTLSWLNNTVAELKKKKPFQIPIWIWNWSTVSWVSDIITQFFMLESWVSWLSDLTWSKAVQWLASYLFYWDTSGYNGYDSKFVELTNAWQNSIDLFSKRETFMIIGYPRIINEIKEKWFPKNFLLATPFPLYYPGEWKILVNYNYFVINKDSENKELANNVLEYLSTDIWANDYLKQYPYYIPALLSLESDKLDSKIHDSFNVVLSDFVNSEYELSSFDKWIKNVYDKNIVNILDNSSNYESTFSKFRSMILCKSNKIITLEKLSVSCE